MYALQSRTFSKYLPGYRISFLNVLEYVTICLPNSLFAMSSGLLSLGDRWLADPVGKGKGRGVWVWVWVRWWGWVWGNGKSESKDKWFAEFSTSKYLNIKQKIIRVHQIFHFFMHILKVSSHSEFGHSRGSRFLFYSYISFLPHSYPIATIPPWNVITICIKLFFITRWNNLAVLDLKQFPSFLLYEKSLFGSTPLASSLK